MQIRRHFLVVSMAAVLFSGPALGQAYRWLDTSPVRFFTDEDWEMLRATAREVLDNGADGTEASWSNPATENSGSIKVLNTYEENGLRCRRTEFSNHARGLSGSGIHRLCKVADGTWKIAP